MEDTRILCEAGEKGKIVVNKCLDHGIEISTYKLIKLLNIKYVNVKERCKLWRYLKK